LPWEDRARPAFGAFFATVKLLFTKPRAAYESMPLTNDVLKPYLFAIIAGWVGSAAGVFWQTMLSSMMESMRSMAGQGAPDTRFLGSFLFGPITLVLAPLLIAAVVLVSSLVAHLFLMLFGAGKSGFVATLRILCYAQAAMFLEVIPGCGGLAATIVSLMFTIIGVSAVHKVSTGRAAAAVLLPGLLCCTLIITTIVMLGGAAFLSHFHPNMHP
jgi:hypothetical protein